jgi:aconitase A
MPLESLERIKEKLDYPGGRAVAYNILKLKDLGYDVERLPYSVRVLLENAARHSGRVEGALEAAHAIAQWPRSIDFETPFMPHRVLLQDYTGVPLVVDLAAMRDAARRAGVDPAAVNSKVPVDLVIDHSIQVDAWGSEMAFSVNLEKEYERNGERYSLLKWAQTAFKGMRVFPPGKGICHQFNLEYLSRVVSEKDGEVFPDTLVGTDSHTTMVNGLGVLGWGVGGIEAEAVMLGEPYHMPVPRVLGVKFTGTLREGVTPTDLVLTVTERLREKDLVGAFVEYFGEGYGQLSAPDRATIGNMSPEYGATAGYFPVDESTLAYLRGTARPDSLVEQVSAYTRRFGFFVSDVEPRYSEVLTIDLDRIEPSIAGPRNPEERHPLVSVPAFVRAMLDQRQPRPRTLAGPPGAPRVALMEEEDGPVHAGLSDGAVVIAAITSCTNTSNPTVMVGAGLIAKKAVEAGLSVKPWVKPSLAPGSTVVTDYLSSSGLAGYLDRLGFGLVGYGCTTCISEGTPVLLADGTARPIESMPVAAGPKLFGPTSQGGLKVVRHLELMDKGVRDCVELVLQDGRSVVCTPDHRVLRADGTWVRADGLAVGRDRVVVGLEAPLDLPGVDEAGYVLRAGGLALAMDGHAARSRALAFARLVGHLSGRGLVGAPPEQRLHPGHAIDREAMLDDIELLTGVRPGACQQDARTWSIGLPTPLAAAMASVRGAHGGEPDARRPELPDFVLEPRCPASVVREFLGGLFGAAGDAPALEERGRGDRATLGPIALSLAAPPAQVDAARGVMRDVLFLLERCGVQAAGAALPVSPSSSSSRGGTEGLRLTLPDGLAFVERVGFRYCVEKQMRATAAAAYWRPLQGTRTGVQWSADRIPRLQHRQGVSYSRGGELATLSLSAAPPVATLLPGRTGEGSGSPAPLFRELGVLGWFSRTIPLAKRPGRRLQGEEAAIPTFSLEVVARRPVGKRRVYDMAVDDVHAFIAGTVAVHNCIGNSGPLAAEVEAAIKQRDIYAVAVLSGNRNFEGRIHPLVRGSFLMSPMLVVAYALAGLIDFDFATTPLGVSKGGRLVYLRDLWPTLEEVKMIVEASLNPDMYAKRYADAMKGDERWEGLLATPGVVYSWDPKSTYIREPPWFEPSQSRTAKRDIRSARALAVFGDKITTDHISPAGTIPVDSPAGTYLTERGVGLLQLSTYGSRRGNHEVMVRGGFFNIRIRNLLAGGKEGGYTAHLPDGEVMSIYDAASKYTQEDVPLVVLAGKQYGTGSSRDWAAKAPKLLGVRAVIAQSFERIHRSNLVAMGVLPLQFKEGEGVTELGLTGEETFDVLGVESMSGPKQWVDVVARAKDGEKRFKALVRVDNPTEMKYIEAGGVLPYVFGLLSKSGH